MTAHLGIRSGEGTGAPDTSAWPAAAYCKRRPRRLAWRAMRSVRTAAFLTLLIGSALPKVAAADQPQDWILAAGEDGTYATLDFLFGGVQAGLEHRMKVYGNANMLTVRGSAIAALPFGSTQADIELRMINLTLGTSVGYQSVWRNQTFDLGDPMNRKERREREAAGEFDVNNFPFWEGRASIAFPFNDYVLLNHVTAWRISGVRDRSWNNLNNVVDDGRSVRLDFQLFFKHKDFGGFAPTFQILNFDLDDDWRTQFNYGFMFVTRAGLVRRDDLLVFQMNFHSGSILGGGIDNRDVFGQAFLRGPVTFLLVYRSVIEL